MAGNLIHYRMRLLISACVLAMTVALLSAQDIPEARRVDWSLAGMSDQVAPSLEVRINSHGGVADGTTVNNAAILSAINALKGAAGIIKFAEGTYLFTQSIDLPDGVVLKGEGAGATELQFALSGSGHCISATGIRLHDSIPVQVDILKGDFYIEVEDTSTLIPGKYILLLFDDQTYVHDSWADRTVGQINRIVDRDGDGIYLQHAIRRDYPLVEHPYIENMVPAQHIGIECLKVKRLDMSAGQTTNMYFNLAAECWISGVESEQANFAHVTFQRSTKCGVSGSYFHHAFQYGTGGKAYGVVLQNTSGDIKVENSIFEHLRHSILLQAGVNGNVIAFNYSTDPYKTINIGGSQIPTNFTGDLVCHGNHPYANLFEGNAAAYGIVDASHGANGQYNTYFRNRMDLYGMQVSNSTPDNNGQNIIGNEVSALSIAESDHYEFGNNHMGTNVPPGTDALTELSLFAIATPNYFNVPGWPSIGYPSSYGVGTIPAQVRYSTGNYTTCPTKSPCPDSLEVSQIGCDSTMFQSAVFLSLHGPIYPFQTIHLQSGDAIELTAGACIWQGAEMDLEMNGCP